MASDRTKIWVLNLAIVLSGLFLSLPIANALLVWLAQVALIILIVRYRYTFTVLPALMAFAMVMIVYGWQACLVYCYLVLLPGVLMGYKARTYSTPQAVILWGFGPYLLPIILTIIYYAQLGEQIPAMVAQMQAMLETGAHQLGVSGGELEAMLVSARKVVEWMVRLLPGILFTMFLGLALFAYIGASAVNSFFGAVFPRTSALYLWKANEFWLVPLAVALGFVLLGNNMLKIIGENFLVFLVHLYAFYGICFFDYYFKKANIPLPIRIIIYAILLVAVIVAIPALAVVAVIDSRFDFRKIGLQSEE